MNVEKFIDLLPLTRGSLLDLDPNDPGTKEFLSYLIKNTTPIVRSQPLALDGAPEVIKALYSKYDLSKISLSGGVSFLSAPIKKPLGWIFADEGGASFMLLEETGEVEVHEESSLPGFNGSVYLSSAAKNVESFLAALLCSTVNRTHFSSGLGDEPGITEQWQLIAQLCTCLAGGEKYQDFWRYNVGY